VDAVPWEANSLSFPAKYISFPINSFSFNNTPNF
jgi:hypothetical protein